MTAERNILLGRIVKTLGFDGTLVLRSESDYPGKIKDIESVFLIIEGKPVPFFIEWFEQTGPATLLLRLEDIKSALQASVYSGTEVFLAKGKISGKKAQKSFSVISFTLLNSEKQKIGIIEEISETAGSILIHVKDKNGKEILVPLHDDLIVEVDEQKKLLVMSLPEGITELNN